MNTTKSRRYVNRRIQELEGEAMFEIGFYCDKCGVGYARQYGSVITLTKHLIIRIIREHNFSVGKQILCPDCKRRGKK